MVVEKVEMLEQRWVALKVAWMVEPMAGMRECLSVEKMERKMVAS